MDLFLCPELTRHVRAGEEIPRGGGDDGDGGEGVRVVMTSWS